MKLNPNRDKEKSSLYQAGNNHQRSFLVVIV
jgi:hypothetical protein